MVVLSRHDQLDLDTYWQIVDCAARVEIAAELLAHVDARRAAMEAHLAGGAPAYGVTTGLGYFSGHAVGAADQAMLQRSILVGRAAATGPPLPQAVVRGAMLLRLTGFLSGHAGVTSALCTFLADRLNDGWYPAVPAAPSGAAGETTPLCHLFQTLIGEGDVVVGGRTRGAADELADAGVAPYELASKEGIALVNGAPLAPAMAAAALRRAMSLVDQATVLAALVAVVMDASWRPYSPRIGILKGDSGQQLVHEQLATLVRGAPLRDDASQAPVSLRVLPQVHGAALDVLGQLRSQVELELGAVTDSPLYLERDGSEQEGFYPSGNFHAQALAFGLDATAVAMAQVATLSERRLHRLLDHRYSGLPDQLAADADRGGSGLVSLHKAAVGRCADNRLLAAPASIHSLDTSSGQEDIQSFAGLSAGKLDRLLDNVEVVLAAEAIAACQAAELSGCTLPSALQAVATTLRATVPFVDRDRSLAADVDATCALFRNDRLVNPSLE